MSLTVSSALFGTCLSRCLIVSLLGVTMSRNHSLTQSHQTVRQVLTANNSDRPHAATLSQCTRRRSSLRNARYARSVRYPSLNSTPGALPCMLTPKGRRPAADINGLVLCAYAKVTAKPADVAATRTRRLVTGSSPAGRHVGDPPVGRARQYTKPLGLAGLATNPPCLHRSLAPPACALPVPSAIHRTLAHSPLARR